MKVMLAVTWRETVASLLAEASRALAAGNTNLAGVALGTAQAYLEKARASGDTVAADLLLQLIPRVKEDPTQRFSFAPGEIEKINLESKRDR